MTTELTIDTLKDKGLIILECISGSKAYGLDTANSDTDIKGVFVLPKAHFYGLNYTAQVSNPSNDIVYYELRRYMELLSVNNPNILELLNTPESSILYKHPFLDTIQPELILSKLCLNTFGKFALSQIKKAKGLNKKIVNPVDKQRKGILSFCYICPTRLNHSAHDSSNLPEATSANNSIPLSEFLSVHGLQQSHCGLAKMPHMKDIYGVFYSKEGNYSGIVKNEEASSLRLSSIPKEAEQIGLLYFNKEGYSKYNKDYKSYWEWVDNRSEVRYENTLSHGKNYDAKNMMHVFRLLEMAIEIGRDKTINVKRPNRDFLLGIKNGQYEYDELIIMANKLQNTMELEFAQSDLPEKPDLAAINHLCYQLRERFYHSKNGLL